MNLTVTEPLSDPTPAPAACSRRYRLAGQGVQRLSLRAGDYLLVSGMDDQQVLDILPLTPAELQLEVCSSSGLSADDCREGSEPHPDKPTALEQLPVTGALATRALLEQNSAAADRLRRSLNQAGAGECDPDLPVKISAALSAGATIAADLIRNGLCLRARQDQTLLLLTPAADLLQVAEVEPVAPAEVLLEVISGSGGTELPEPLADPELSLRVPHSSARAYRVRAGDYIQIIDVAGKQCSDFIAFDRADVDAARRGDISPYEIATLDAAATRTMMGQALPSPGLHSRFFDQHMQAMLEVAQDTVGRHDSFLMACTPRFYEDAGHFGHPSCTANFNQQLKDWGVPARAGWPAINFFFNTRVCDDGMVTADEPWSRPGDYVLLRAQRDLLCLSSACPDDIDAANGWTPTDIHVRVYSAASASPDDFPRATAWRNSPEELPRMTQQTGFHARVAALTQHLSEYRGYWVADEYNGYGATAEYLACRERVAVIDLTPLRKFEINGPDAERLLQLALTRNVRRLAIGEIAYTALCHPTGGMMDDGTLFRLGQHSFRLVAGDSYVGSWLRQLAAEHSFRVRVQESTSQIHNLAVQGPRSRDLLTQLVWTPEHQVAVAELAWFHLTIGRLGGPQGQPLMVTRTGYTGELGFEIWCHPEDAEAVWDAVQTAGEPLGIAPMGFKALDMLRIEAGLIFADHEFCPQTNPYEAGIGFTVPMKTKEEDFIGRTAMARQNPASRHRLMGLLIDSEEPVAHGDEVYPASAGKPSRTPVGVITSATYSPLLKQQIALARLAPEVAEAGCELAVGQLDGLQKRIPARVTTLPFYDPERTRVRS